MSAPYVTQFESRKDTSVLCSLIQHVPCILGALVKSIRLEVTMT